MDEYAKRRKNLFNKLANGSLLILEAAKIQYRSLDAEYLFRQNNDFLYLTGSLEPDVISIFQKDLDGKCSWYMFCHEYDADYEIWHGPRLNPLSAKESLSIDDCFEIREFETKFRKMFIESPNVFCFLRSEISNRILKCIQSINSKKNIYKVIHDASNIIHEMRLIKSDSEIKILKKAASISAKAHLKLMEYCEPGMMEYHLEAEFIKQVMDEGCRELAYPAIVASGNNAIILHYCSNQKKIKKNDLILIDAGGEYKNYASDITRTFPANKKFSSEQKDIYQLTLNMQKKALSMIKPEITLTELQNEAVKILVDGLIDLKILSGSKDENIEKNNYKKFYMHSLGHWIGMDVHDVGSYETKDGIRKLKPNMAFTVEPGIYIGKHANVDKKWHGIGVRIEDEVVVTDKGVEVITFEAPKEISDIENL